MNSQELFTFDADLPRAELRIARFLLAYAVLGSVVALGLRGWRAGAGFGSGALLSFINFRWLVAGASALSEASVDRAKSRTVRAGMGRFLGRFLLLAAALCVIFFSHLVAFPAVLAGLFVVVAAILTEAGYETFRGLQTGWGS